MIIQYNIGQFSTQNIYSAINITDYSFYPQGKAANPVVTSGAVFRRRRGQPGQNNRGSSGFGGLIIENGEN